ncbi:phage tail family protein [Streptomyces luteireticuli]|uniref:Phage tail family protein n=1 Tax=Streptomyces luteireticuli TaxID=173858 RepID=A0ABP3IJ84_9ACTN
MPIPASWDFRTEEPPELPPSPPQPVTWGHTYVSIRGSDGEGEEIPLTDFAGRHWPAIFLQAGATGLDMPPVELYADASPNLDGSIYRNCRAAAREIMLPLYLYGIDRYTVRQLKRKLIRALHPANGACVLRVQESGQPPRYLTCYYKGGMEGNEAEDSAGFSWLRYGIQLTAHDPWYFGPEFHVAEWDFGAGQAFLSDPGPLFPLRLAEGLVSNPALPVLNPGDTSAWPIWQIRGPVKSWKFTCGKQRFGMTRGSGDVVAGGRTLTIDTRPGYKTVTDDRGTNRWADLDPAPQMWALPAGSSRIGVELIPGDSSAKLVMSIKPRYESY